MCKFVFVSLAAAALSAAAQDGGFSIMPVRCVYKHIVTEHEEPQPHFFQNHEDKTGCEITYLITGDNITGLDMETLTVKSITSEDGTDMFKDSKGRTTWEGDAHTSRVFNKGKNAQFNISVAADPSFILADPKSKLIITGAITVKTGGKVEAGTVTLNTGKAGRWQKIGPFTVSVGADRFLGDDDSDFRISVKGDTQLLSEISFIDADGQTIKRKGGLDGEDRAAGHRYSSRIGDSYTDVWYTYSFPSAPATPEFTLTVSYLTGTKDVTLPIGGEDLTPEEKF